MRVFMLIVKILVFCFLSNYRVDSFPGTTKYFGLISSVQKYFRTSCVFLVHSHVENVGELGRIKELMWLFSKEHTLVSSVEFWRLNETMRIYSNRVVRMLIVVSFTSHETFAKFANLTNHFDMGSPCWLLIFAENIYRETHIPQYGDNIFHLTFNTEMLVARSEQNNVQEWYWLENKVKMVDFATWDFGTEFILKHNMSLYQRRSNLENAEIQVTTVNNPPLTTFSNNTIGGFIGAVLTELSRVANFNLTFVLPNEKSYGSWHEKEKRWTGMIQMLVSGKATIAAGEFTISTLRMRVVDFTLPLISTRAKLYIRKPDGGINWSAYWKALAPGTWIILQLLIIFTTILLSLMVVVRRSGTNINVFTQYFLLVFGIYCQQGLPDFPTDSPSRIAFFSIFLSAIIVNAAYSAALISFLTVTDVPLPFSTLEEFVQYPTYRLLVYQDGAEYDMLSTAIDPTLVKMFGKLVPRDELPESLAEAFRRVCQDEFAFYVPAVLVETALGSIPCKVVGIDTKRSLCLAMALSKGNPYNGLINYHVQKFRDHGILNRLKYDFAAGANPTISSHSEVTLWGVMPVIAILIAGLFLAILVLYIEKIYFAKQSGGSRTNIKEKEKIYSRSEDILKIHFRHRRKYTKPSSNLYHN